MNGEDKGVLARDLTVNSIQRNLRSIITSELPGYGAKGRYLSELGVKTMRDGSISLSETDFNKALLKSVSDRLIEPSLIVFTPSSDKYLPLAP